VEAEPLQVDYGDAGRLLQSRGPYLLRIAGPAEGCLLALLAGRRRSVVLLGPDRRRHVVPKREVEQVLLSPLEGPLEEEVERVLASGSITPERRAAVRTALLREWLGGEPIGDCWLLRLPPGASFLHQMRQEGLVRVFLALAGAFALETALWIGSWWLIGRGALVGRLDWGWLLGWTLLLLTIVPLRMTATWLQGRFSLGAGGLLKRRLLQGALRMQPEEVRHLGAGQLIGRMLEAEAIESLALTGGFLALLAGIELIFTALVLAAGAGGPAHLVLLTVWIAVVLLVVIRYLRRRRAWTAARLAMTHDLIEQMVGYRTRLAQQEPERLHEAEDEGLEAYLRTSLEMDRTWASGISRLPRGWLLLGIVGLGLGFVSGGASTTAIAAGVGGVLLGFRAFTDLTAGLGNLARAAIAWEQIKEVAKAAERSEPTGQPTLSSMTTPAETDDESPVVEAERLFFRYPDRAKPVLAGCSLRLRRGERYLLTGASGGGKSTLAAILAGLRTPDSGLLLLQGLDLQILGAESWRRFIVLAPQFHENHILTETLAFNLLMGRRWPPGPGDLEKAEDLCRRLGLGHLLDRMPSGLQQMVGESGWQLSHGERSRIYIARALLQGATLVLLDESFGALDPETFTLCLNCALEEAPALVVIAHP
jgi:ATP-binding cassette subfamily B protein